MRNDLGLGASMLKAYSIWGLYIEEEKVKGERQYTVHKTPHFFTQVVTAISLGDFKRDL